MSTPEVTPDLMRTVAAAWEGGTASDDYARHELRARADHLEHLQRPLPTVPGWYPGIVVERGGESCTGVLLDGKKLWTTPRDLGGAFQHKHGKFGATIRWAEQDGKTPGQTLWEAEASVTTKKWPEVDGDLRSRYERIANAVLAAHGTPTLTPVGEHPEPGTRGLLPVKVDDANEWNYDETFSYLCDVESELGCTILADPRPDGAV